MEREFVPYEQALELKKVGFEYISTIFAYDQSGELYTRDGIPHDFNIRGLLSAPTFSQAFRWFREKYENLHGSIEQTNSYKDEYTVYIGRFGYIEGNLKDEPKVFISYEEAELECLKKLIEIVKKK